MFVSCLAQHRIITPASHDKIKLNRPNKSQVTFYLVSCFRDSQHLLMLSKRFLWQGKFGENQVLLLHQELVAGVPVVAQWQRIWLESMRTRVWSLPFLSGLRIWHCHELWCRSQIWLWSSVVWLWCRLAAVAPIQPTAWEPPYAAGVALKSHTHKHKGTGCSSCYHYKELPRNSREKVLLSSTFSP